jgi:uncharacterized protein YbjT (DUF2867 family)
VVTGANGRLGRSLLRSFAGSPPVRAVVRSERAADQLRGLPPPLRPEIHVVDETDAAALARVGEGAGVWLHLVGILKETPRSRYVDAHERTCGAVAAAAAKTGAARIVHPSLLGADPRSPNACLASRGRAEAILLAGPVPATVLRLPMVLGPGEAAAAALRREALAPLTPLPRGGAALEQPIDSRDVVEAVRRAMAEAGDARPLLDLAGAEALSHRALLLRVAARLGRRPRILSLPGPAVGAAAFLLEHLLADPPFTRAMLGVIDRDDAVDPLPAARRLGLALTPLDQTLARTFPGGGEPVP